MAAPRAGHRRWDDGPTRIIDPNQLPRVWHGLWPQEQRPRVAVRVRPVESQVEAQEVASSLAEQIELPLAVPFPDLIGEDDGTLRPTLIGAWAEDRLVGGALVGPDPVASQGFMANGFHDCAELIRSHVAHTEGIAVVPERRREGIGLQVKLAVDVWAAQHHACLMLSIPTNDAARRLNEEAGHTCLGPQAALVLQVIQADDPDMQYSDPLRFPRTQELGLSLWAFRVLNHTHGAAIAIGEHRTPAGMGDGADQQAGRVTWLDRT